MLHKVHSLQSPMRVESHAHASRRLILRDAMNGEYDCGGRSTLLQGVGIDLKKLNILVKYIF